MMLAVYLAIGYLIGAFPSSVVFGRVFRGIDVREHGSGNAGGTNAWRVCGWRIGVSVMLADVAKGVIAAALIPRLPLGGVPVDAATLGVLCGVAAVIGHVFPVYIGFRGGKGVATAAGMMIGIAPIPVGIAAGVFALILFSTGTVSLGSILGSWAVPILILLLGRFTTIDHSWVVTLLTAVLAVFITFTHRKNIGRLLRGEERSFPKLQLWRYVRRR